VNESHKETRVRETTHFAVSEGVRLINQSSYTAISHNKSRYNFTMVNCVHRGILITI